jgi:hypothetical protein
MNSAASGRVAALRVFVLKRVGILQVPLINHSYLLVALL